MMIPLISSCEHGNLCTSGMHIVQLPDEAKPLVPMTTKKNVAYNNCKLHNSCGYDFEGSKYCPE